MTKYTLPFEKRGSVVDSWVRGGTRAVPSQCSGPPVSFSAGPGFEPGTYAVSPHVSNHLATWAGHPLWLATRADEKTFLLYQQTHIASLLKKMTQTGIEPWTSRSTRPT